MNTAPVRAIDTSAIAAQTDDVVALNERAVIGAALRSAKAYEACAAIITGADFGDARHETIWDAITWVNAQGDAKNRVKADHVLVTNRLHETQALATLPGGGQYLVRCVQDCVTPVNAAVYAKEVRKAAQDRCMVQVGVRLQQSGAAALTDEDRAAVLADAAAAIGGLVTGTGATDPCAPLAEELNAAMEALEGGGGGGVSTGLRDLDHVLGGIAPGQVVVVGARPGCGKTILGQAFAEAVAFAGKPALFFTFEMSRLEMMTRLLSSVCDINSRALNLVKPRMSEQDWEKLAAGVEKVLALPYFVCDDASVTPAKIDALIGAFKRKHPDLGVVVIDYLQLMRGDGRTNNRQEEIASISRAVKLMAKRHNVPIVLLSQLNRKSEERGDKKPQISDLRESGAIEQDADVVILLHREDQHDPTTERVGEMDLIVDKNRAGESGKVVTVAAQLDRFRLRNMARAA